MGQFQTLDDLDLAGKRALVRVDMNVPMKDGVITNLTRLERLKPTLHDLQKAGARIILLSHFGRPKGQKNPAYSLRPVADALSDLLHQPVAFAGDSIGPVAQRAVEALGKGQILVLENTRFYPQEEKNDSGFAKQLAVMGDVYINDAFSAAHRAHASTEALARFLPCAAGRLMEEELKALEKALELPERPVAAIVGGAKISTKLDLLRNLITKVDTLVLGGGMANTFLAAQGVDVGGSLYESDMLDTARDIMLDADKEDCYILLPKDAVVAEELTENAASEIVPVRRVPAGKKIFDIGPTTVEEIQTKLSHCKTVVWNGPLGVTEVKPFDRATNLIALYVAQLTEKGSLVSVAGGGDTVGALANAGVTDRLTYVSTAGGAFLEWMEGKTLPGVQALMR